MSTIHEVGDLRGFETVWLCRNGIANVLSLHSVKSKGFQIDYNSTKEDEFVVTIQNGTTHKFTPSPNSLYYTDMLNEFQQRKNIWCAKEIDAHGLGHGGLDHEHDTVLEVETVLENKSQISKQDVQKAELVRALQHIAGHLSNKQLPEIAQKN